MPTVNVLREITPDSYWAIPALIIITLTCVVLSQQIRRKIRQTKEVTTFYYVKADPAADDNAIIYQYMDLNPQTTRYYKTAKDIIEASGKSKLYVGLYRSSPMGEIVRYMGSYSNAAELSAFLRSGYTLTEIVTKRAIVDADTEYLRSSRVSELQSSPIKDQLVEELQRIRTAAQAAKDGKIADNL
jgi:hypothetical protein